MHINLLCLQYGTLTSKTVLISDTIKNAYSFEYLLYYFLLNKRKVRDCWNALGKIILLTSDNKIILLNTKQRLY